MAAYAAILSLLHTVGQMQSRSSNYRYYKLHVDYFGEMGGFLRDFLEKHSHGNSEEEQRDLERRIACVAHEAEDVIENWVMDQIVFGSKRDRLSNSSLLGRVKENMRSIKEKVMEIKGVSEVKDRQLPEYSMSLASSSSAPAPGRNSAMVGFEDKLLEIMERLMGGQFSRQIISIVGMGGIGKTTLARSVFEKPLIMHHFDIRIWIKISQQCTLQNLLLQIPICQNEQENRGGMVPENRLGEVLYKSLSGKRYLVILDDVWGVEFWDKIKFLFPNNDNMSRIIVTTRLSNVATHFGSCSIKMSFLDKDKSWELFCKTTFGQDGCPPEFENIGKDIALKCSGLPLLIVVIGGLLTKFCRIKEYWESVAKDINSFLNLEDDEQRLNVLSLSYNHLSIHLKPCFLYMGIFPEDHEIRVSQLIKLWVAEGFLKPQDNYKSWEEIAECYLGDLVDRNLVLVHKRGLNGKIKTCYIHDLLRDLCLRIAQKEGFICILRNLDLPQGLYNERRIVFHEKHHHQNVHAIQHPLCSRTLMCGGGCLPQLENRLLHVLDAVDINSFEDIFQQVNLRYFGSISTSVCRIPSSISRLWNVQTIICQNTFPVFAPTEIWTMKQLRHVEFREICLPDPPSPPTNHSVWPYNPALGHLQTFMKIVNFKCTREVLRRIPHIKKLEIKYEELQETRKTWSFYFPENICYFSMLESLKVCFYIKKNMKMGLQRYLTYPSSLKKLTLDNIEFCWDDLAKIGSLPILEDVKLKGYIAGPTWNPVEEGFRSLKSLRIAAYTDLVSWNVEKSHFPVLENLELDHVHRLDEIPMGIGEIPTLKVIRLGSCTAPTAISALNILVEQKSYGNEDLQVRVTFMTEDEKASFRAIAESKGLTNDNFMVETRRKR